LTCPVESVVAVSIIVSRIPVDRAVSRTSRAVTAPIAVPRKTVRRVCWMRLRSAIVKSTNSLDMV
jgi:hypothetical protein